MHNTAMMTRPTESMLAVAVVTDALFGAPLLDINGAFVAVISDESGAGVGDLEGLGVGEAVGTLVGDGVGDFDGSAVGDGVGLFVGAGVGDGVGSSVGRAVVGA